VEEGLLAGAEAFSSAKAPSFTLALEEGALEGVLEGVTVGVVIGGVEVGVATGGAGAEVGVTTVVGGA